MNSFNSDPETTDSMAPAAGDSTPNSGNAAGSRRTSRAIVWATIALCFGPVLWFGIRHEIAQWYTAAAYDAQLNRDWKLAYQRVGQAIKWDESNDRLLQTRIGLALSMGDARLALRDCDRCVSLARDKYEKTPNEYNRGNLCDSLNTSAYALALAEERIDEALEQAKESLQLAADTQFRAGILDTRGYLYFLNGDLQNAKKDMESAVQLMESEYALRRAAYRRAIGRMVDKREFEMTSRGLDESRAVLYHHRGLVYQRLGEAEAAQRDLERARQLGYDPKHGVW